MLIRPLPLTICLLALLATGFRQPILAEEPTKQQLEFFEKKIRPVLVKSCYECHSADSQEVKGGLLLDTRAGIRDGGESGHGVVPGRPEESVVLEALRYESFQMPPDEQLPDTVIADFEKWIKMGAPDPRDGKKATIKKIDIESGRKFWAFQPVKRPVFPVIDEADWSTSPIDRFIRQRQLDAGVQPVELADKTTLVRRIYFDLIGLPPTPEQLKTALQQDYPTLVEELLRSPHFGERWGRHWLDVVRYAESTGMERNYTFPHAWRYRDYVIQALNSDKPYDQFIREQLAGDLLPAKTPAEKLEQISATGFLAIGPKSLNEPNRNQFLMDVVDDQIDVTTRAFLGVTVACARCHDHKFDPFPQAEYYQLAGIFRSTRTLYGTVKANGNRNAGDLIAVAGTDAKLLTLGNRNARGRAGSKKQIAQLEKRIQVAKRQLAKSRKANSTKAVARIQQQLQTYEKQLARLTAGQKRKPSESPSVGPQPSAETVMGVLEGNVADTAIRLRGEPNDLGPVVPRGMLSVMTHAATPAISKDRSGRLELANWIAHPEHPLTARVAVNRMWLHLFGRGIVPSVNNFGANGERPSHPKLLDYLAAQFIEQGWSTKAIVREIVLSRTYRLASLSNAQLQADDPDNHWFCRQNQRRLEAEAIRDAMLLAAGQLEHSPGKKSPVAAVGDGNVGRGIRPTAFADQSNHRSVYLPIVRGAVPEVLRVFDFPEPSMIAGAREVTTVPTQALYLLNSPFVLKQAETLAREVLQTQSELPKRIETVFLRTLSRKPTPAEVARTRAFLQEMRAAQAGSTDDGMKPHLKMWVGICHALLASAEFRYLQ